MSVFIPGSYIPTQPVINGSLAVKLPKLSIDFVRVSVFCFVRTMLYLVIGLLP